MNIRTIATLAVALFLGLLAALLVRSYVGSGHTSQAKAAGPAETAPVVVAVGPIVRGAPFLPAQLKIVQYPAAAVPLGAFHTTAELTGSRRSLRALSANQPILASDVTPPGGRATLSGLVTNGMRAVAVRSNDVVGVGGFVLPGDHVDVLVTRPSGKGDNVTTVTQVLAQNVRVLAVDQTDDTEKPLVAKAVTVEVTPEQAGSISLGQAIGTVSFSLRGLTDDAIRGKGTIEVANLDGGRRAPPPLIEPRVRVARAPAAGDQVHVTRGVETTGYGVGH